MIDNTLNQLLIMLIALHKASPLDQLLIPLVALHKPTPHLFFFLCWVFVEPIIFLILDHEGYRSQKKHINFGLWTPSGMRMREYLGGWKQCSFVAKSIKLCSDIQLKEVGLDQARMAERRSCRKNLLKLERQKGDLAHVQFKLRNIERLRVKTQKCRKEGCREV